VNENNRGGRGDGSAPWHRRPQGHGDYSGSTAWKVAWAVVGALFFFVMAYGFGQS
jgi:hypothetical protein